MKTLDIGPRLKAMRAKANVSAKDVARSIGVAESTYRDWEYGRAIKGEPYVALAKTFGVTLSELMMGELDNKNTYVIDRLNQIGQLISEIKTTL